MSKSSTASAGVLKARDTREKLNVFTVILLVCLVLYAVSLFTPLAWGLLTSFKKQSEFRLNIIGLPKKWVWNYSYVFKMFFVRVPTDTGVRKVGMGFLFLYAFLYAAGCAFTSAIVPCVTSYLCALRTANSSATLRLYTKVLTLTKRATLSPPRAKKSTLPTLTLKSKSA